MARARRLRNTRVVSKSNSRKTPAALPGATPLTSRGDELVLEAKAVLTALHRLHRASEKYAEMAKLAEHEIIQHLRSDAYWLEKTIDETTLVDRILTDNAPVAPRTAIGGRWVEPLTPSELIELAAAASELDAPYLVQLDTNQREDIQRRERLQETAEARCGRNGGCSIRPVYMPGDSPGPACWRHLTTGEGSAVEDVYDLAVAQHSCAGCGATPGAACELDEPSRLNMVDGKWPLTRAFRGRKVHKNRLDQVTLSSSFVGDQVG